MFGAPHVANLAILGKSVDVEEVEKTWKQEEELLIAGRESNSTVTLPLRMVDAAADSCHRVTSQHIHTVP